MENPLFSRHGVPIRFPKGALAYPHECSCIHVLVDDVLDQYGGVEYVSHISVEWDLHQEVRFRVFRFGIPSDVLLGTFKFSDRKVRPLFLNPVTE